ncbi:MAG: nitrogenase iron-molybdenum cofactor biosynthesis protein NifE [Deltaproteobacteria bacterium]|jgi:nitrogenase molybdenum-cofactor synthesis protein NifE|nr:nitrogenase iron-molybdenum cofactor biosynthesis protein NifE [Deltaproteobacteria bacterium]
MATDLQTSILEERKNSIHRKQSGSFEAITCESASVSGSVSQRACVYCGARVVLNPITDAFHIVHGPIGCASYTWDIRGSLSSGSELYRNSFSTDLQERDVVFGGAEKLAKAIDEVMASYAPKLIFVYSTCIVGVIGDDVEAVCRKAEEKYGNRVIPVKAPGFSGSKSTGYRLACNSLMQLLRPHKSDADKAGVNILGDYNLAGEMWIIKNYLREADIPVLSTFTGDASYETLIRATSARLNVVQCAGSMMYLARLMEDEFGIPWVKASFFGMEDTTDAIRKVADLAGSAESRSKAESFIARESSRARQIVAPYYERLAGKKAAIFVGGGFKAISLVRQFKEMGMETVVVGTQTGTTDEYEVLENLVGPDTVIMDDANPAELETFMREKGADILVGGVKERPLAYKLGIAFCDHNHERRHALAGYEGVENFAREVNLSINSPVWRYANSTM